MPICDDSTNHHRPLVIEAYFNTHIPISMVGYTCVFITRYPADDKIETCQHITLSNEHDWDTSKYIFKISSMEEERMSNMFNIRSINQLSSQTPCGPPVTYTQDYMAPHDFDRAMVNF